MPIEHLTILKEGDDVERPDGETRRQQSNR
jgi:hypothetical protein